jgi:hypothetical protein
MSRHTSLYWWIGQVAAAFPRLSRPQATVLALYSFGAILAHKCGLTSVGLFLASLMGVSYHTVRSRLQEFYQPASVKSGTKRRELDVATCFAPLLAWVLKGWPSKRLALALDATSLGKRFTALSIHVVYRGCGCPVAWRIVQANVRHAWKPEWIALLRLFRTLLPAGLTVIVMSDRGLYARWLFEEIVALGWHPLMRITRMSKFRKKGSRANLPVTAFVPNQDQHWQGSGTAFPRKSSRRLNCTLLACWESGHDEPWFVVTDLGADHSEALWYGMRAWIEHGFKLLKHDGWQWQMTRMTDPDRASRLWLVMAVATRYLLAIGGETDAVETPVETFPEITATPRTTRTAAKVAARPARPRRPVACLIRSRVPKKRASGTKQRLASVFLQGLAILTGLLATGHALPTPRWKPEPWLEIRVNYRTSADQPPTPVPKNPSLLGPLWGRVGVG